MENYFNYFTEIEEHFQRRWGGILRLSPIDWVLIETWKNAGIPLEAVLRGIDATFEHYERRPSKTRKVNGLGFCSQEVLAAAEDMKEAAVGANGSARHEAQPGFEPSTIAGFLLRNADILEKLSLPGRAGISVTAVARETAKALRDSASAMQSSSPPRLEALERHLTVLEEKLLAILLTATPDAEIVSVRAQADLDLMPYRRKMPTPQIEQLRQQYLHKRLLEKHKIPRLSLFYM